MLKLPQRISRQDVHLLAPIVAAHALLWTCAILIPHSPESAFVVRRHNRRDSDPESFRQILEINVGQKQIGSHFPFKFGPRAFINEVVYIHDETKIKQN